MALTKARTKQVLPNARRGERGFTLLEAMIAMGIFFIGAVGVMRLQLESIRVNRFGAHMTQAMLFADERAQELLTHGWDDTRLADGNSGNNAFPSATPTAATPDVAESAATMEGLASSGAPVAIGTTEQFQRYWMVADQDYNATILGADAKRIRVMVRFKDGESTDWREVGVTVVKAKVQ